MSLDWIHPGLVLIVGAWLMPLLKGTAKRAAMILVPAVALIDCLLLEPGTYGVVHFLGQDLTFGRVDRLEPGVRVRVRADDARRAWCTRFT